MDFVIIDMEHGAVDFRDAAEMVMAAQADNCSPLIRVPNEETQNVLRALETEAEGIMVPHVSTAEQCENFLNNVTFPPKGIRGFNPYTRAGHYGASAKNMKDINKETLSGLIIEDLRGVANLSEIIKSDIDLIYIGVYDLSAELGIAGQTKDIKVRRIIKKIVDISSGGGKTVGCLFHNERELKYYVDLGIQFLCYEADTAILFQNFAKAKKWVA